MDGFTAVAEKDSRTDALLAMSVKRVVPPSSNRRTTTERAEPYAAEWHPTTFKRETVPNQVRYSALMRTYSWDRSLVQTVSEALPALRSTVMVISSSAITAAPAASV